MYADKFVVAGLYVAVFGRAADAEGLSYWTETSGLAEVDIARSFFCHPKTAELYPETMPETQFVSKIYENIFGREAEPEGVAYWSSQLQSGTLDRGGLVMALMQYAQGGDMLTQAHKSGASLYFADCGLNSLALAEDAVKSVTAEASSLQEAKAWIDGKDTAVLHGLGQLPEVEMQPVQALMHGAHWPGSTITYSFNETVPPEYEREEGLTDNWHPFSAEERQMVRTIFANLESFLDLSCVEVAGEGEIRFNKIDMKEGVEGFSYYPDTQGDPLAGDVFISNSYADGKSIVQGSDAWFTVVHEIGHALGLKHPFEGSVQLPHSEENTLYTVMSYEDREVTHAVFSHANEECRVSFPFDTAPAAYQLYDMMALQAMYGVEKAQATESDHYLLSDLSVQGGHTVIWDAGGNDTLDVSMASGDNYIWLKEGTLSSIDIKPAKIQMEDAVAYYNSVGCSEPEVREWVERIFSNPEVAQYLYTGEQNLAVAQGTLIENVITGSGNDTIYDNALDNSIISGAGDDHVSLLEGGYDIVMGGSGIDSVYLPGNLSDYHLYQLGDEEWFAEEINGEAHIELWGVEKIVCSGETLLLT